MSHGTTISEDLANKIDGLVLAYLQRRKYTKSVESLCDESPTLSKLRDFPAFSGTSSQPLTTTLYDKTLEEIVYEDDRFSSGSSGNSLGCDNPSSLTTEQLKMFTAQVLKDRNVPQSVIDDLLNKMSEDKMRLLINQDMMTKLKARQLVEMVCSMLQSEQVDSKKVGTIKVLLAGADVSYVEEFATTILPDGEHRENGLELVGRLTAKVLSSLCDSEDSLTQKHLLFVLTETIRCIRIIMNTVPGITLVLRHKSRTLLTLLKVLSVVNTLGDNSEITSLRREILKMLGAIVLLHHESIETVAFENSGCTKLVKELSSLSNSRGRARFQPLLSCLKYCTTITEAESLCRVLLILTILINRSDDNIEEKQAWQMRMRMRSEIFRDGLAKYITRIEDVASQHAKVDGLWKQFCEYRDEDFEELASRFETTRGDYETLPGAFQLLASSTENTTVEPVLLSILQLFMLIPEDSAVKLAYFRLIESCVSEIVLHKNGVDPDFQSQFHFETTVAEMIEQLQDSEISRKLERTVQAKQEAVAKQMQYWQQLSEFRKESELLRKHVSGWKESLPSPGDVILETNSVDRAQRAVNHRARMDMQRKAEEDWEAIEGKRAEEREKYLANRQILLDRGWRYGSTLRSIVHKNQRLTRDTDDGFPRLKLLLRTDVDGTLEAIMEIIDTYSSDRCRFDVVDFGVGPPTERDIEIAKETGALLYLFNVQPPAAVRLAAERGDVRMEHFNVIYRLVEALKDELSGRLPVQTELELVGEGHVLKEFLISDRARKRQPIAGCLVDWGTFNKNCVFKFLRGGSVVYEGEIESMKCEMELVANAKTNTEVGIALDNKSIRFKEDDSIEVYEKKEVKQTIDWFPPGF